MIRFGLGITILCILLWIGLAIFENLIKRKNGSSMRPVEWPSLKDQWLDVNLPIKEVKQISPGHFRVVTQGVYNGEVLGLTFDFNDIDPNSAFLANPSESEKLKVTSNGVVITSQGSPTDNFVRTYAKLANKTLSKLSAPDTINLTAITLGGNPRDIDKGASKIKVFHADDQPEGESGPFYFEAYINPDVPHGYIEFHEKDPGYRDGVLRSFGAQF